MRHEQASAERKAYTLLYLSRGHFITYERHASGGPDPSTRQVHAYERGDTEVLMLTPQGLVR